MREKERQDHERGVLRAGDVREPRLEMHDPRPARRMTLAHLLGLFAIVVLVKGGVVALMGHAAYTDMLTDLGAGNIFSRFAAFLLHVDPLTLGFAQLWQDLSV